jgi:glutaredoxin
MGRFFKIVAIALGLYLGWQHFTPKKVPRVIDAQTADIEIYTTPTCPYCKQAKAYMNKRGIAYLEKDIEYDSDNRRDFENLGGNGVPLIIVYGQPMSGFSEQHFEELLSEAT